MKSSLLCRLKVATPNIYPSNSRPKEYLTPRSDRLCRRSQDQGSGDCAEGADPQRPGAVCGYLRRATVKCLSSSYKEEALHLRNRLLLFRFRNLNTRQLIDGLIDRTIEPRLNQVFVPLLSIIPD